MMHGQKNIKIDGTLFKQEQSRVTFNTRAILVCVKFL